MKISIRSVALGAAAALILAACSSDDDKNYRNTTCSEYLQLDEGGQIKVLQADPEFKDMIDDSAQQMGQDPDLIWKGEAVIFARMGKVDGMADKTLFDATRSDFS